MLPHSRISSIVRQQPSHKPEGLDMRHMLMQGEGKSPPLRWRVACKETKEGLALRTGMKGRVSVCVWPTARARRATRSAAPIAR